MIANGTETAYGVTMNGLRVLNVLPEVLTVIVPVVAPAGTVVDSEFADWIVAVAATPLNETALVEVNPCPRISTVLPTAPIDCTVLTNGGRLPSQL